MGHRAPSAPRGPAPTSLSPHAIHDRDCDLAPHLDGGRDMSRRPWEQAGAPLSFAGPSDLPQGVRDGGAHARGEGAGRGRGRWEGRPSPGPGAGSQWPSLGDPVLTLGTRLWSWEGEERGGREEGSGGPDSSPTSCSPLPSQRPSSNRHHPLPQGLRGKCPAGAWRVLLQGQLVRVGGPPPGSRPLCAICGCPCPW